MHSVRGFTLLETLVVVALIAIIAGSVVLSAGAGTARELETHAQRLRVVAELVCDKATIEAGFFGLGFAQRAYSGFRFGNNGWEPVRESGPLVAHALPEGYSLRRGEAPLERDLPGEPQWICSPAGDSAPLDVIVASADGEWRIGIDEQGRWQTAAVSR